MPSNNTERQEHRREKKKASQQASATTSDDQAELPPPVQTGSQSITDIRFLITLPRFCVAVLSAVIISTLQRYAPKYLEPVYGNVFPYLHFSRGGLTSLVLGAGVGILLAFGPRNFSDTAEYDTAMARHLNGALDLAGIVLCLSPLLVDYLFQFSQAWGPYMGPHLIQMALAYPILFTLGIANVLVMLPRRSSSSEKHISDHVYIFYFHLHIFGIIYLVNFLDNAGAQMSDTCTRFTSLGYFLSILVLLFKILLKAFGEVAIPTADSIRTESSWMSGSKLLLIVIFVPQIIAVVATNYNSTNNPHCGPVYATVDIMTHGDTPLGPYKILARQESITGWISVVEFPKGRFLRAGHSILGGRWHDGKESVYSAFYAMEAVSLIERDWEEPERGLMIGLGVGIAATSMLDHDISLDIVELDPIVHAYACDYFDLPLDASVRIDDGRQVLEESPSSLYNYVLHDVFTGGSVPSALFTEETFLDIRRVLKDGGILALNFIGSSETPHTATFELIVSTVKAVFPYLRSYNLALDADARTTYGNMAIFASTKPITLREPTAADLSGNLMRAKLLNNVAKWEVPLPESDPLLIVTDGNRKILEDATMEAAEDHWWTMNKQFGFEFWLDF